jgi:cell division protein FtsN
MSSKPSLYVVERKEVVVLVILFVLVTVLAFTLGVKYGETLGRKAFLQDQNVQNKMQDELAGKGGSGLLGESHEAAKSEAPHGEATEPEKDEHGKPAAAEAGHGGHGEGAGHGSPEDAAKTGEPKATDEHGGGSHSKPTHESSPEEAAQPKVDAAKSNDKSLKDRPKEPVDTNSDQHLLQALQEAGIQPPKGGAGAKAGVASSVEGKPTKLPDEIKTTKMPRVGSFTIQVGSYPTKSDAEQQLKRLKDVQLDAMMLAPVSERNGEWYRVTVGTYTTKTEADKAAKSIQAKGHVKTYFVRKVN